ncbi:MAG: hypothetical protein JWN93_3630 [Hyphomicrobiales bacterium]|nr:hypothetical protein [Hyphomicrobiales bacterium]
MIEIMRTNDLVLISAVEAMLAGAEIGYFVADTHMSVLEGSAGFLPRRILVERDRLKHAVQVLTAAGYGAELAPRG